MLALTDIKGIQVDAKFANARDENGLTLIPPTLSEFAHTFSEDLKSALGVDLDVTETESAGPKTIFITINEHESFEDRAGRTTSEGYILTTNSSGIFVEGASPLGAWWGTRTILQQAILNSHNGPNHPAVPFGKGKDVPGWPTRGMMLDAGRHFYPKEFLGEMCAYMSFFKQNTFHLHVTDNLNSKVGNSLARTYELGAWFRLWSDNKNLEGLATMRNESYTREEFDEIQTTCAARGVTVLPEIEAPGHALRIVQWRPQIGFDTDLTLLNISHPDTIPTMKLIWKEFLPWFHSKTVSIGADEYHGPVADYNSFVNTMNDFIRAESGKDMRIWGTFPPKYQAGYTNIAQTVTIQHWAYYYDHAVKDYMNNNYSVVNSDRMYYVVNKWNPTYPAKLPINKTFHGDPSIPGGGPWYPNIFDVQSKAENTDQGNKHLLGAVTPLWNDFGPNATTVLEAYYAWREGLPALADKQWGGKLTEDSFSRAFATLHPHIPGQNLDRAIPSKQATILDYSFGDLKGDVVPDASGNGYDARTTCKAQDGALQVQSGCDLTTPWSSKGRDYTLTLDLTVDQLAAEDSTNTTLIWGGDSTLMLTPNVTLFASGFYYRSNTPLPLGEPVKLAIRGQGDHTYLTLTRQDGSTKQDEFTTLMGIREVSFRREKMAIEAPIHRVSGWTGALRRLSLVGTAQ